MTFSQVASENPSCVFLRLRGSRGGVLAAAKLGAWFLAGLVIGGVAYRPLLAQAASLMYASNSATGTAQVIATNGSNALKVLGK